MTHRVEQLADGKVSLLCGDCLTLLPTLEENSIDSAVCDPPYHLHSITKRFAKTGRTDKTRTSSGPHQRTARGFMNKLWDGGEVAFQPETWRQVLRVLKPGAYLVAFSSCRTFGRMQVAIEEAGFITHPFIAWIFAQGFPKAHRVHDDAWDGWRYGTQALKPAIEPIYMPPKERSCRMITNWTNQKDARLREYHAAKLSYSRIADDLNSEFGTALTRSAVSGRIKRLGMSQAVGVRQKHPRPKIVAAPKEIPQDQLCTLMQLTSKTCRFVIGDPCGAETLFCGAETIGWSSYCSDCHRLCYHKMPAPARQYIPPRNDAA